LFQQGATPSFTPITLNRVSKNLNEILLLLIQKLFKSIHSLKSYNHIIINN